MKNKIGLKSRIVITFSIFIIFIINIFTYLLYIFIEKNFINNLYVSIYNEYETITTFLDLQDDNIFSLPDYELKKINSLNFFFYIGNDDKKIESIALGFTNKNNKEVVFRGVYKGTNIIIGKKINDLKNIQSNFIDWVIFLNIFTVFFTFFISYLLASKLLNPLLKLSKFLNNYDIDKEQKLIKNNYGNTEIGKFTDTLNKFILKTKNIFDSQKEFIRDVSHELKTPLMQIDSSIELLESKLNEIENIKRLDHIKDSVENINNLISKLGFILRGEEFSAKKESIDMYIYLENLINNFRDKAIEKNITINLEKNNELVIINNTYYLDRLFGNLLSNSILYNNGNNEIKVIVDSTGIEIIDKGIGIEKTDLEKVFNRFYRNPDSGLYYKNGNGLGLTIAKKICDIFGWKIKIESEKGVGSSFRIEMK